MGTRLKNLYVGNFVFNREMYLNKFVKAFSEKQALNLFVKRISKHQEVIPKIVWNYLKENPDKYEVKIYE